MRRCFADSWPNGSSVTSRPFFLAGKSPRGLFGGRSPRRLRDAVPLKNLRIEPVGRDMLIQADFSTH